jgi:hypothetical protein
MSPPLLTTSVVSQAPRMFACMGASGFNTIERRTVSKAFFLTVQRIPQSPHHSHVEQAAAFPRLPAKCLHTDSVTEFDQRKLEICELDLPHRSYTRRTGRIIVGNFQAQMRSVGVWKMILAGSERDAVMLDSFILALSMFSPVSTFAAPSLDSTVIAWLDRFNGSKP